MCYFLLPDVCAAFAASFLIRIARLFPKELDLRQTAKDVEELACILDEIPAGRYARSLRLILRRARKQKYIPPLSRPASPKRSQGQGGLLRMNGMTQINPSQHVFDAFISPSAIESPVHRQTIPSAPSVTSRAPAQTSPATALLLGGQLANHNQLQKNDSPISNPEAFQFDFDFAQELWQRAGMREGEMNGQQLPL